MANLVVCADGTWNTPDDEDGGLPAPTNVVKLNNAVADHWDGVDQKKYYHPGVGAGGRWYDRLRGGGLGWGLDNNIRSAYRWLAANYEPGDSIFLFGFSRGAYTVRSLGGMISCCGLLDLRRGQVKEADARQQVRLAFECYRERDENGADLSRLADSKFHNASSSAEAPKSTPIHFIGVWDTVGALGIPERLRFFRFLDPPERHRFHDTDLSGIVRYGRHAVAMDEMRYNFVPTLWSNWDESATEVKQLWFPGVHGNVGGGYFYRGLSDGALRWMIDEAREAGLQFKQGIESHLADNPADVLHDSRTGIFSRLRTEPRQVPRVEERDDIFHPSATRRHRSPPLYQPGFWNTLPLAEGQTQELEIFAAERWNVTRIFLEKGATYRFAAGGEWLDGSVKCGPGGPKGRVPWRAAAVYWAGTQWKREREYPWFALVGVIASGIGNPDDDKDPLRNEAFMIGEGVEYTPVGSGYLYCFANDAWRLYFNNKGSVSLTVERVGSSAAPARSRRGRPR